LDDVDPCSLFTEEIVDEYALRGTSMGADNSLDQATCQMLAGPPGGYIITTATNEGMERFEGIPEEMAIVRDTTIGGFSAAELLDAHQPTACLVGVDVADGQLLSVYVNDVPEGGTQDEVCEDGVVFTEAVIKALRQS
jgi:hypothetical protein